MMTKIKFLFLFTALLMQGQLRNDYDTNNLQERKRRSKKIARHANKKHVIQCGDKRTWVHNSTCEKYNNNETANAVSLCTYIE